MKVLRVGSFLALLFATTLFIQNANAGSTYAGHSASHGAYHGSSGGHSTGTALKGIPYHGSYGSGYGHGYYGHGYGNGYYGHGYGNGYYGHGYGYYPHYGFSVGFGYGYPYYRYYSPFYYWPYYYPYGYGYGGGYGYGYGYGGPYYAPDYGYSDYPTGDIRTEVKPKTAKVYVDGNYVGTVDSYDGWYQRLKVPPGKHRIVFRETGYTPYVVDIGTGPGQDFSIKYDMVAGNDSISEQDMMLPPGQRDDYDRGYNPNNRGYNPNDGGYGNNPGYNNQPYGNEGNNGRDGQYGYHPNDQQGYSNQIEPGTGRETLSLTVTPADATIYVDGNFFGTGDMIKNGDIQVLLSAGQHKIEVVRPGYQSYVNEIAIEPGAPNRLDIVLQQK